MEIQSGKSSKTNNINLPVNVDTEWLQLLLEAKAIGLSLEDVREFLKSSPKISSGSSN
ncbi:anti-repressor SinI family protein [Calidifontibacillus oryziterrae]|uniref:anti-repressor SinI family protein n=1 Tax=Calidifontibacillus oryziterrae TaxID=1191699 RepID=UPI0002D56439|nr:anti-repressor SinI family protein [Calidifontibacillus oryziterrae]